MSFVEPLHTLDLAGDLADNCTTPFSVVTLILNGFATPAAVSAVVTLAVSAASSSTVLARLLACARSPEDELQRNPHSERVRIDAAVHIP